MGNRKWQSESMTCDGIVYFSNVYAVNQIIQSMEKLKAKGSRIDKKAEWIPKLGGLIEKLFNILKQI